MHLREKARVECVVAIERQHEFAARAAEAGVTRGARPLIALTDHGDRGIEGRKLCARLLVRAVVDNDDLEIAEGLRREGRKQPVDEAGAVVAGHDNADGGRVGRWHGFYASKS